MVSPPKINTVIRTIIIVVPTISSLEEVNWAVEIIGIRPVSIVIGEYIGQCVRHSSSEAREENHMLHIHWNYRITLL
jgi:hypothetical protein